MDDRILSRWPSAAAGRAATGRSAPAAPGARRLRLGRRGFGLGLAAAGLAGSLAPAHGDDDMAYALPEDGDIVFDAYRNGELFGTHKVTFTPGEDRLAVDIAIDYRVKVAFVTAFSYEHRNHEEWQDGRLVFIKARTDDDGTVNEFTGEAVADGFRVTGTNGGFTAPPGIVPTSYWNKAMVRQSQLLDTLKGTLIDVGIERTGSERVATDEGPVDADRYLLSSGNRRVQIWYGPGEQWVKLAFRARGNDISYVRTMLPATAAGQG